MGEQLFPKELLNRPLEEKHKYFETLTVSHPAFEEAYQELLDRICNGNKNAIILVFGPAGAGKTKLIEKVIEQLVKENQELYQKDRGLFPYLAVEAVPPDTGNFDWKDFYYRSLVAAKEELIDHKIDVENKISGKKVKDDAKAALRRSLEMFYFIGNL